MIAFFGEYARQRSKLSKVSKLSEVRIKCYNVKCEPAYRRQAGSHRCL